MDASEADNITVLYEVVAIGPDEITLKATLVKMARTTKRPEVQSSWESQKQEPRNITLNRSGRIVRQDTVWTFTDPTPPVDLNGLKQEEYKIDVPAPVFTDLFVPELIGRELKPGAVIPAAFSSTLEKSEGNYTVGTIQGGTANVSYTGKRKVELSVPGLTERTESSVLSQLRVDAATGLVISRETVSEGTLTKFISNDATAPEYPVKIKTTISVKITRAN